MEDELSSMCAISRRLADRRQGHDRHQRTGIFLDAGVIGLRHHGRGPLRGGQHPAHGPQHRHAHGRGPGRRDAGPLGALMAITP